MSYLTDGKIGIDLTLTPAGTGSSSDQDPPHTVGTTAFGNNATQWMFVHASGAIDQYDFVTVDENGEATALADAGGAAGHVLGVAQVAFADNDFGWVCIDAPNGGINGNILASCAADTMGLWTTGTAGHADDATSAGAASIRGVVAVVAASSTNTNKEIIMRNAHFNA